MTAKKSKQRHPPPGKQPNFKKITALVVFFYYAVVIALISCSLFAETNREAAAAPVSISVSWVALLKFTFYGLPFVFAIIYGMVFRPFWQRFRDVLVAVFAIHLLYSFFACGLRYRLVNEWRAGIAAARMSRFTAYSFRHQYFDQNHDGFVERVRFEGMLDATRLPAGEYSVYFRLAQAGELLAEEPVGSYKILAGGPGEGVHHPVFEFNPQELVKYFRAGPLEVDVYLYRKLAVTPQMRDILFYSRWAPFFRTTGWEGNDPYVRDTELEVQTVPGVDTFRLRPIEE